MWLPKWLLRRQAEKLKAKCEVIQEVLRLHPRITGRTIAEFTGIWGPNVYVYLMHMEESGLIESEFVPGPDPRRRVYWLKEKR